VTGAPEALSAGETVPHVAPLQFTPDKVQVKPLFWESFWTEPVKDCVAPPVGRLAVVGDTLTVIAGPVVIAMAAEADLVASETEIAVKLTVPVGTAGGAV
jgi:hypothetical protein